jgi:hypothetical protein
MPSISDFGDKQPEETPWDTQTEKTPTAPAKVSVSAPVTTKPVVTPSAPAPVATPVATVTPTATSVTATKVQDPNEILNNLMSKIGDIGTRSFLKIMIYGDPGSTKSSFAATAPNNLIVDLEDGMLAAKNSPNGIAENVKTIRWNDIGGFNGFSTLISAFQAKVPQFDEWETLSIDSFSEAHKRGLQEVTEREWRKRPSKNRYVAETEEHTENNERMTRLLRDIRDMDRNLILIAHARTVEPKNKPAKTYPDFSEKLANAIEGMMDLVGYMTLKTIDNETVPVMVLQSPEGIHCKTRFGLPVEVVNPTYPKIKEAWEAAKAL